MADGDKNIVWHAHSITRDEREAKHGLRGAVLWFTGLSGSGKSTLANAVARHLFDLGAFTYVLDGDNVRHGLNRDLGFSPEDRRENIRRIAEVARLFADAGALVCTAFISPYVDDRQAARALLEPGRFVEVYCSCPLAACERRDPKGLYRRARAGQLNEFTGISAPYEPPPAPEVTVMTNCMDVGACVERIMAYLREAGIVSARV